MIALSSRTRIFVATDPTDMRKSFDGLLALVESVIREDPLSGHLFLFRNRRGDRMKALWWDRSGFSIWYKLLQKGTFAFPKSAEGRMEIDARDLVMILEGLEYRSIRKKTQYQIGDSTIVG